PAALRRRGRAFLLRDAVHGHTRPRLARRDRPEAAPVADARERRAPLPRSPPPLLRERRDEQRHRGRDPLDARDGAGLSAQVPQTRARDVPGDLGEGVMEHIPESELAVYAFDPAAVPEERRNAVIKHLAACAACRATHDFFAVAEDDLGDADVWERTMGSATYESLMAYAARIAAEDEEGRSF